ncbi:hypothetical protein MLD38_037559 [Melastoma candidum]|uniref:Uncharacterized protein n=2 Tax=Melastoma candidum TaxID=119954 RepID=A0ACB9LNN1_9MYRT|nr:hypothetical protein MLD38_037555 [Melastoma candidum]KAI4312764.1 hypothetical protein MLD38_037559 [Melastoma candidum]
MAPKDRSIAGSWTSSLKALVVAAARLEDHHLQAHWHRTSNVVIAISQRPVRKLKLIKNRKRLMATSPVVDHTTHEEIRRPAATMQRRLVALDAANDLNRCRHAESVSAEEPAAHGDGWSMD